LHTACPTKIEVCNKQTSLEPKTSPIYLNQSQWGVLKFVNK
jgi:hypothetical protein